MGRRREKSKQDCDINYSSVQSLSSVQTLCDPMNHSTPDLPVHHQLPESTQTHVHGQRRSLRKMVGGVKSCLELNPIPSRDAHRAQTKPCVNQETLQTEPKLSLGVQFSSLAQSCPTLCNPMNCSTPGLPVHHQLPEFTQTHVHRVSDAIQPFYSLLSPSPSAPNLSQHQSLFQ